MYYAYVESSLRNTGIYWASPSLEKIKADAEPHFEFMKKCKATGMLKGVFCIRFYKDEEFLCQWGSW